MSILKQLNPWDIFDVLTDVIYVCDMKGTILWVNQIVQSRLEYTPKELIGTSIFDLENKGIINPSVTRLTIEKRDTVKVIQTSKGRKYLASGHILSHQNQGGSTEVVVTHVRLIDKLAEDDMQLEDMGVLLKRYGEEIRKKVLSPNDPEQIEALIGESKSFLNLLTLCRQASRIDTTLLITGETGVGKNLIANYIHRMSERNNRAFVHLNCGSIPEALFESELFGYTKGSFTGATSGGKKGLVESANGGILFLDEISEIPLHIQSKLLQFLQDKTYFPIGSTKLKQADVQIMAATNKDLLEMVSNGTFRSDLYYRLSVLPLYIPALRERKDDIPLLLDYFLSKYNDKHNEIRSFSTEAIRMLETYDWPGNIRQLENLIERIVITARDTKITKRDLADFMPKGDLRPRKSDLSEGSKNLKVVLEEVEKELVEEVWNRNLSTRETAKILGLSQSSLMRRLKKYGL